jgi:hypothetical protein
MFRKKINIKHDILCLNNPCICNELDYLRENRAAEKAIKEQQIKHDLARKALDGKL